MFARIARLVAVVSVASVALTACTPPMPPEVKAALLERSYTCVEGSVSIQTPETMAGAIPNLQAAMGGNCPGMNLVPATADVASDIVIGKGPWTSTCEAVSTVPYALDAGVVAATLSTAGGLILRPKTIAGIFDGSITSWDDAAIAADNGGVAVGTGPIQVLPTTDKQALAAFGAWYQQLTGKAFKATLLKPVSGLSVAALGGTDASGAATGFAVDGTIALLPYSVFSTYAVTAMTIPLAASVLVDAANPYGSVPDVSGIGSAGTQLTYKKSGSDAAGDMQVTLAMNYDAKPVPPQGMDVAPAPYQAIYPVNLSVCGNGAGASAGKPSKLVRAVGRYLLRQDAQGALTTYVPLPELIRAESLDVVSVGLPQPKVDAPAN